MIEIKHDFEENKLRTLAFLQNLEKLSDQEKKQKVYNALQNMNLDLTEYFTFGKFKDSFSFAKYTLMKYAISLN